MPQLPAYCRNCRIVIPSLIEVGMGTTSVSNVGRLCPRCGEVAYIPDGIYSSIGNVVVRLAKLRPSVNNLNALKEIIRKAQAKDSAPEEVKAEIQEKVPELNSLSSYFPKTRNEFYAFLSILIALLAVFVSVATPLLSNNQALNKEQVEDIVNRAIMNATGEKAAPRARKKVGRNESCPCGSGKKYKKCCLNAPGGAAR